METTTSRRRSQRLFLQVKVILEGKQGNKSPFSEETHTVVVNAHGALVETSISLDQGQIISMQNVRTAEKIDCSVKLVTSVGPKKFNTAVEFTKPNPGFWRISFPLKTGPCAIRMRREVIEITEDAQNFRSFPACQSARPQSTSFEIFEWHLKDQISPVGQIRRKKLGRQ